jgi:hypothetical protein
VAEAVVATASRANKARTVFIVHDDLRKVVLCILDKIRVPQGLIRWPRRDPAFQDHRREHQPGIAQRVVRTCQRHRCKISW